MTVPAAEPTGVDEADLDTPVSQAGWSLREVLDRLECVRGRRSRVSLLSGGLTNRNYRVTTDDADLVVRISPPDDSPLAIDRIAEHANSQIAAGTGVGAAVVEFLPGEGIMAVAYIPGRTLTEDDVRSGVHVEAIAEACRRLHAGPRFVNDFDMFQVQARYLSIVRERGFAIPADYLDFAPAVERIRAALAANPVPTVPCNNDLLAGNMIDEAGTIRLIDYEYSGNNDPCFEIGNVWSESTLDADQLEPLVTAYYRGPRPDRVARARLLGLMSKYGWTLWAAIQHASSDIDFDFWSWGMEKYDRARQEFTRDGFDRLLDQAAGGT
ncbi:choline kinase family protein [Fodinicola acaciae]|uniref:choline kinase family protein n=1 Tax=Fodinicola acaciae TaxID=2681555 RepID=UPI0013D5197E|nr:choline kinase family protein [Fodinicola acaciae]